MARKHHRTPGSFLFLCGLALAAWSLLALATPLGVDADDEKGATERWCDFPPAARAVGVARPDDGGADAPPAPPPPPPGEETPPAEEILREEPAPTAPVAAPVLVTRTAFDEGIRPFGPIATAADWNGLSKLILEACEESASRARKAPKKLMDDWGDTAPMDGRMVITLTAHLKDGTGAAVTTIPENGAAVEAPRSVTLAGRDIDDLARRVVLMGHAKALKQIAADVGLLKQAGYTGMVEVRTSMTVTISGTPSESKAAERAMTDCGCAQKPRPSRATPDEEEKAAQLYWFMRKAYDSDDRVRMFKLLREILALPPNKYTTTARKFLDARLVPRY